VYVLQIDLKRLEALLANNSLREVEELLEEGPTRDACCMGCGSFTTGDKCEECIPGHFRGTEDLRAPRRPYAPSFRPTLIP
jgi:hypothetical protein